MRAGVHVETNVQRYLLANGLVGDRDKNHLAGEREKKHAHEREYDGRKISGLQECEDGTSNRC